MHKYKYKKSFVVIYGGFRKCHFTFLIIFTEDIILCCDSLQKDLANYLYAFSFFSSWKIIINSFCSILNKLNGLFKIVFLEIEMKIIYL